MSCCSYIFHFLNINCALHLSIHTQGVVKVRKRVTLMVVAVTAIFGICWCTASVVFLLQNAASYNIGPIPFAISNKMVLFNSAVNPFVYALLNQQFREKMKGMFCCNSNAPSMVHPTVKLRNIGLVENNTPQTHTVEQCSTEWCVHYNLVVSSQLTHSKGYFSFARINMENIHAWIGYAWICILCILVDFN